MEFASRTRPRILAGELFSRAAAVSQLGRDVSLSNMASAAAVPKLTLYEMGTSRSARCRWMLAEAGLEAEFVSARPGSDEAKAVHPLGKLPALVIEDSDARTVLFESAAIVTYIADLATSLGCSTPFIAAPGSVQRAQHDQWVSFALTELDAHLWHTFIQGFQPDKLECAEQDKRLWRRGGAALELHLAANESVPGKPRPHVMLPPRLSLALRLVSETLL